MKQLTRIRLINWYLFENTTITCNGTTYLIGVNGVGKSTILDVVQFALVGGQRDIRFNQAAIAGGERTWPRMCAANWARKANASCATIRRASSRSNSVTPMARTFVMAR